MERVPQVTLGWRLQMALAHGNVGQQEMADELDVSRSTISRWMNDHGAPPRRPYIVAWALKCGVDVDWLSTGTPRTTQDPRPTLTGGGGGIGADSVFGRLEIPPTKLFRWGNAA